MHAALEVFLTRCFVVASLQPSAAHEAEPEVGAPPLSKWKPPYGSLSHVFSPSGHHDMILGLAWMHTHPEGRGGHGTHGGFRERSERYQRHTLGGG